MNKNKNIFFSEYNWSLNKEMVKKKKQFNK